MANTNSLRQYFLSICKEAANLVNLVQSELKDGSFQSL